MQWIAPPHHGTQRSSIVDCQTPDAVVPHAVVFRQDDFDAIAAKLELAAEPEHDVAKTADLYDRGAFRGHHDYVHRLTIIAKGLSNLCCM